MNSGVGQVHQIDVWDSVKAVLLDPAGCCSGICTFLLLRCLWSQHVIASYSCYCYWYQRKICLEHLVDLIDVDHGWCHVLHGAALLRWQCSPIREPKVCIACAQMKTLYTSKAEPVLPCVLLPGHEEEICKTPGRTARNVLWGKELIV